jgi:hypothetical protein
MPRVGQTRKRDANEAQIVAALRRCGAQVLRLGSPDAPDLLVRCGAFQCITDSYQGQHGRVWGKYVLMEVKAAKGKLKPGQTDFHRLWPETVIVRSVADALAAIGAGT